MPNFVVMGSCVSGLTGVFLRERGWQRLNTYHALRSPHFVRYFIDRDSGLPSFEDLWAQVDVDDGKRAETRLALRDNYPEFAADHQDGKPSGKTLMESLETEKIDVFLLDNWHEANLHYIRTKSGGPGIADFGLHFDLTALRDPFRSTLEMESPIRMPEMAQSWLRIIRFLRDKQPQAKIFFLCAHYVTSWDKPERARVYRDFFLALRAAVIDPMVHIIPPLELDDAQLKLPDEAHYEMDVYRALAGHVIISCMAKWPDWSRIYEFPQRIETL